MLSSTSFASPLRIANTQEKNGALKHAELHLVKIGSQSLVSLDGELNFTVFESIADQVSQLRSQGILTAIISSGAVAAGRKGIADCGELSTAALAALGQARIIGTWNRAFLAHQIAIGQIHVTGRELRLYPEHLRETVQSLLRNGIVPILNGDDIFNNCEQEYTTLANDNDKLAGTLALELNCRRLLLLTQAPGVLKDSKVLRTMSAYEELGFLASEPRSALGTGGILSKVTVAQEVAQRGIEVLIGSAADRTVLLHAGAGTVITPSFDGIRLPKRE